MLTYSEAVALLQGAPLVGCVDFYYESLLIGQVTVWATPQADTGAVTPVHRSMQAYQSIFPSYSRIDSVYVENAVTRLQSDGYGFPARCGDSSLGRTLA